MFVRDQDDVWWKHGLIFSGITTSWWCYDLEMLSQFLALCVGNHHVGIMWGINHVDSPHKGPVMWSFDVYLLLAEKPLNKQSTCQCFEMPGYSCHSTERIYKDFLCGYYLKMKWYCYTLISLRPSNAPMHQYTRPSLVQIMTWCLFRTKPLSEPMLVYQ